MSRKAELEAIVGSVSRETLSAIEAFEKLFRRWNASINLASPASMGNFWSRHILDSAQLWAFRSTESRWLDLGSGGGLPGLVISILGAPDGLHCTLVESNHKKSAFLRNCATELGLNVEIQVERIESVDLADRPQIISARALASLDDLLRFSSVWIDAKAGGRALFHKGRDFQREVDAARDGWEFDLIEHVSVVDAVSRVLEISNVRRLER